VCLVVLYGENFPKCKTMSDAKYCTECGAVLRDKNGQVCSQLYDADLYAKSGIIKLVSCSVCGLQVADKYVECDGALC